MSAAEPLLDTRNLRAFYGDFQALFGIDLSVDAGETVAIIGANGAGKSTFLKSIAGLLASTPDSVRFAGQPIGALSADRIVKLGIALVPEGRRLFPSLSVEENLRLGGYSRRPGPWSLERIYRLFPALRERRQHSGAALSGGQQQMVAIGRALMANPQLLLCDEISLGLAPIVIKDIYQALPSIIQEGTTTIIVEQDIGQALAVANRVYCFQKGRVALSGNPATLSREQITHAYFGL
ncbi:MAG: ABC transporter ATP-binding protein [Gammaproteobacteria bacterium]